MPLFENKLNFFTKTKKTKFLTMRLKLTKDQFVFLIHAIFKKKFDFLENLAKLFLENPIKVQIWDDMSENLMVQNDRLSRIRKSQKTTPQIYPPPAIATLISIYLCMNVL